MFTYPAKAHPNGNENQKRYCKNSKCSQVMYVKQGADNYRCPYCDHRQ